MDASKFPVASVTRFIASGCKAPTGTVTRLSPHVLAAAATTTTITTTATCSSWLNNAKQRDWTR